MSFKLLGQTKNGVRLGDMKGKKTPRFFITNDFGGGGTNVSRFFVYSSLFAKGDSDVLLNYYYLNNKFKKKTPFNADLLENIQSYDSMSEFLEYVRKNLIEVKQHCQDGFEYHQMKWDPLFMFDNGSGNIFRDLQPKLRQDNFDDVYVSEIEDYIEFCEKLKIDLAIGLDIAGKYTLKKGEHTDKKYAASLDVFTEFKWNLRISELFLQDIPDQSHVSYYAALHGDRPEEYLEHLNNILTIEKKLGSRYSGFAIGGLGKKSRQILELAETVRFVRSRLENLRDYRPIHILGVGSAKNIIPLSVSGADTFDCHTPWRRANEDKLMVPLLNSRFEVVTEDDSHWKNIHIDDIPDFDCDCSVCKEHSLSDLKRLMKRGKEESYYFRILAFKHNLHQQEILCDLVRRDIDLYEKVSSFPESSEREKILQLLSSRP